MTTALVVRYLPEAVRLACASKYLYACNHSSSTYLLEDAGMQDLEEKCSKDFWTTTAIEMAVWPPYQVLTP